MAQYFILIKRKSSKNWSAAIPTKPNATKEKIRATMRKQLKPGFTYRITTKTGLRSLLNSYIKKKK